MSKNQNDKNQNAKKEKLPVKKVILFMLKTAAREKPALFAVYFLRLLRELINRSQMVILPKLLIDELVAVYNGAGAAEHLKIAAIYALITLIAQFVSNIMNSIAVRVTDVYSEYFNQYFQIQTNDFSMTIDFEQTEDPAALDQLKKAKDGMTWYSGNVTGILDNFFLIINNIIVLCGVIAVIAISSPLLIPIQLGLIAVIAVFNKKQREIEVKSFQKLAKVNRVFDYVLFQLNDFRYGKDIRLYESEGLFHDISEYHIGQMHKVWKYQAEGGRKQQFGIDFVSAAGTFIQYVYIGGRALKGILSIGDFTMCVAAADSFSQCCQNIVRGGQEVIKRVSYANEYLKFLEYPAAIPKGNLPVADKAGHEIEFRNVSFKYPRAEKYVLKDVSLKIPSGQHLALVGLNGAGKTTLIKLLCRLYDVTDGEILIDGINIKDYDENEYRRLFAVVFQDFKLFAFTLEENIAFTTDSDKERLFEVLKQAGLSDDVEKLPLREKTCLWKSFDKDNGVELSGGQQQKTAIARALYKNSPIVILDEPTAALDPIAEAEIYSRFNTSLAGGKTAVYISHRLSSCKFCDYIAVFDEGKLSEYGTHVQLMKHKGLYHKMFTAQAEQYVK